MTTLGRRYGHLIATVALTFAGFAAATAAPSIQAVYTDHSKGGTPVSINIVGNGFTCADCEPPRVSLGGLSLTVKAHSAKVITAVLPQPVAAGDYTLAVTTGPTARAEVARFSLSVAPANPGRVVTTPAVRSAAGTDAMPPPPNLLRGTSTSTTRTAGPLSRSGRSSGKTSTVTAAGAASTAGIVPQAAPYQVVSGLPEYNTAYGDYALFDLSRGYNSGTRGNSAFGYGALLKTTSGSYNNGFGFYALYNNVEGGYNSAFGNWALYSNTGGLNNSAVGHEALYSNTTGRDNAASGAYALRRNTTGFYNTAIGSGALSSNTTAHSNTASGYLALHDSTTGVMNTASGAYALMYNTTGRYNTASGGSALSGSTTGDFNTANGALALAYSTTGSYNTALGYSAGGSVTTGTYNTALGYNAGLFVNTGSYNINIGAETSGSIGDDGVIRLGKAGRQTRTFIAGIRGVTTGLSNAVAVLIDSDGQLGTVSSSRRYKEDIHPMGSASDRLFALRPVTFRYKQAYQDGSRPVQFGLIAEEVAEVFPELAVYGKDGQPDTVSYHLLATLLLNELQKEHKRAATLEARVEAQTAELSALRQEVTLLAKLVGAMEKGQMVASAR